MVVVAKEMNLDPTRHLVTHRPNVPSRRPSHPEMRRQSDELSQLQPLDIYYSVFFSEIADGETQLGAVRLQTTPDPSFPLSFSLERSHPTVLRYFTIGHLSGLLGVASNTPSGYYSLDVTVSSGAGSRSGEVGVYVCVVTNTTLDAAVVVTVDNVSESDFVSKWLEHFVAFVAEALPCQPHQVEVVGVQGVGLTTEVAIAVRQVGGAGYLPATMLLDRLEANKFGIPPLDLSVFLPTTCDDEPCPTYQQCRPSLHLGRYDANNALKRTEGTDKILFSHLLTHGRSCVCPPGYSISDLCASEVNECDPSPCHFGATCKDLVADYHCTCSDQTTGKNCSIVCPSELCDPCNPSPCLHGASCQSLDNGADYKCQNCPWNGYGGKNCELTSLHFDPGSFAAFPPLGFSARLEVSLRFAAVTPSGLLLYNGRVGGLGDYLFIELVSGQVRVGVSLGGVAGGVAVEVMTESVREMNDGEWHDITVAVDNTRMDVSVSGCLNELWFLQDQEETCHLHTILSGVKG